eukprot:Skav232549  [mRNA]  locus=scaffold3309:3333:3988:- [translate_table: standard]
MLSLKAHLGAWTGPEAQFSLRSPVRTSRTMGYCPYTPGTCHGSALEDHEHRLHLALDDLGISWHHLVSLTYPDVCTLNHMDLERTNIELRKLFLVRRRSFPRDAHLIHSTQETFTAVVTSFTVFWYLGLSFVTFNNELHTWTMSALLLTWLGSGLFGSILVSFLVQYHAISTSRLH